MTNDEAREGFKDLGLHYGRITRLGLRKLQHMIEFELISYLEEGSMEAKQMQMTVANMRKNNVLFEDGKLIFWFVERAMKMAPLLGSHALNSLLRRNIRKNLTY